MNDTIFRKKSLERIASPDQLSDYLKTSSPSIWMLLAALVLALAGALAWCFLGSMPTTVMATGVVSPSGAVCFIPAADGFQVSAGIEARVTVSGSDDTLEARVALVGDPAPAQDAAEAAGAGWLLSGMPDSWVCAVTLELEHAEALPANAPLTAQIILDERRPIDLLWGR